MSNEEAFPAPAARGSAFPATQWSVVLRVGDQSESQARAALEALCRQYWYPLYVFVRRQNRSHHEAEDCTQEFLVRLLANAGMTHARPELGRFRTFLLTGLRNFLINEWQRAQTAKRGGGLAVLSLELEMADKRFAHEPADPALTPEQAFDRSWAHGMIEQAIDDLRAEYDKGERAAVFAALRPFLLENSGAESHAPAAARIGLSTHTFTVALHRIRRRLGDRLRARVAETVTDEAEVAVELRHLISAVTAGSPRH